MNSQFVLTKTKTTWGYTIPVLDETKLVKTAFSTKVGPVYKGDKISAFKFCNEMGIDPDDIAFCGQVHGNKVVTTCDKHIETADGIMTDKGGIALVTFYADCVPLYFLDTVNKAIAISHAGWRGTTLHIGANTLYAMNGAYGTQPDDCIVVIGPSIGKCCFEVDYPVAEEFRQTFARIDDILDYRGHGKYHIDLPEANASLLRECGVLEENIYKSNICTSCTSHILFSYRSEKGTNGRMAAVIMLV